MNVVAYCGNKDARKIIRTLEFYNSAGCILFQVLLSNYDVVAEVIDCSYFFLKAHSNYVL